MLVTTVFVLFSSWAIYNAACVLADGLISMTVPNQHLFRATLFQYLWIFSISAIFVGGIIHFYITKKITHPLKKLIHFTKKMKAGSYTPIPTNDNEDDEIGELINHFNDLAEQLEMKEKQRKKIVADLSHEFRTPLTNLNGYLRALQSGVLEGDERLYQALYEESSKLTQLVEQMEKLKQWDDLDTQEIHEKETVEIQEFIEKSIEIFQWSMQEKEIELQVEVDSSLVLMDHSSISQVISNLVDNAIRYYAGTGQILIKGEKLLNDYKFSLTGPGMPISEMDRKRIFERLYRVEPSRSRELGGSGLGLAISKEIIDSHQGKIGMESNGNVHTFWFTLPLANTDLNPALDKE